MAIFLTTSLVVLVDAGAALTAEVLLDLLPSLLTRLGLGALVGLGGGWALAWLINRIDLHSGLEPPFALAGAVGLFAATQLADGSGFLAIYLCGVMLRAFLRRPAERIIHFHEGLAWLAQIAMLIMLGLLVTPAQLGPILLPAFAMAAVLIFVARPLAVLLCLLPFRFPLREQLYIGWVGLRGAVPIFLAIIPVISPGPITLSFFNIVFVIVITSLVLQGWTLSAAARWLGVAAAAPAPQIAPARRRETDSRRECVKSGAIVWPDSRRRRQKNAGVRLPVARWPPMLVLAVDNRRASVNGSAPAAPRNQSIIRDYGMCLTQLLAAASLAAVAFASATFTAGDLDARERPQRAHHKLDRPAFDVTLSTRPADVSGGQVLVRIEGSRHAVPDGVKVLVNGYDVSSAFHADAAGKALVGLVEELRLGRNALVVVGSHERGKRSGAVRLALNNYPIAGPILSGPHQEPFICMTETFAIGPEAGTLGPALDDDCSIATRVDYFYRTTAGAFTWLADPSTLPADLAETTTSDGNIVPYIIRVETGTINRAIYQTAVLHDPAGPEPDPWTLNPAWNQRLIYRFGGGCRTGWYVQGDGTGGVLDDTMLSQGYATASSTLNVFGNNCNDLLTAESMMMVKERFIEAYGFPRHTIGWGCSGGSYQNHQIGDNYPGLLDGIIAGCTFPEVGFATIHTITDARLLENYFNNLAAESWTQEEQRLVSGFGKWEAIANLSAGANRIDPDSEFQDEVPVELRYDPVANPGGARATVYDHTVNVYGVDRVTGFARRPLDNIGIQYGLEVLNTGAITKAQFLDLNEKIGGFDEDANHVPERTEADLGATRLAYQTGRLLSGGGGLAAMPMIDYRAYSDLLENGDIHMKFQHLLDRGSARERQWRCRQSGPAAGRLPLQLLQQREPGADRGDRPDGPVAGQHRERPLPSAAARQGGREQARRPRRRVLDA
jgi:NhaP-type Na+/H+ or K+/H+ antiporter